MKMLENHLTIPFPLPWWEGIKGRGITPTRALPHPRREAGGIFDKDLYAFGVFDDS